MNKQMNEAQNTVVSDLEWSTERSKQMFWVFYYGAKTYFISADTQKKKRCFTICMAYLTNDINDIFVSLFKQTI